MAITPPRVNEKIPILDGMRCFYSRTANCNFVPRLEITMSDTVVHPYLQSAAEIAMSRYRVFRLVVKNDEYGYYLVDNNKPPIVHIDNGMRHVIGTEENNDHLTWIGINGNTIIIEFFHGVSDIHGALPFIELLLRCYCSMRYNIKLESLPFYSTATEDESECSDSLSFVNNTYTSLSFPATSIAYQFPEKQLDDKNTSASYSLKIDALAFESFMRYNHSSRSAVLAVLMSRTIASVHPNYKKPIIVGIGADVRSIYGAEKTLRDCTDTLSIYFDETIKAMPLNQQLQTFRQQIVDNMQPSIRLAHASSIKINNALIEKKCPLLKDKLRFCKRMHQYAYLNRTYGISNVGHVSFGEELDFYIECFESIMGANILPIVMEIVKYKEKYNIVYCTRLENDPYVYELQQSLIQLGIPCTCEKRRDFSEALTTF